MRVQREIHALRHHVRVGIGGLFFHSLCGLIRTADTRGEVQQLVDVGHRGGEIQVACQQTFVFQPRADVGHFAREGEVGVTQFDACGVDVENLVRVSETYLGYADRQFKRVGIECKVTTLDVEVELRTPFEEHVLLVSALLRMGVDCQQAGSERKCFTQVGFQFVEVEPDLHFGQGLVALGSAHRDCAPGLGSVHGYRVVHALEVLEVEVESQSRHFGRILHVVLHVSAEVGLMKRSFRADDTAQRVTLSHMAFDMVGQNVQIGVKHRFIEDITQLDVESGRLQSCFGTIGHHEIQSCRQTYFS